MYMYVEGIGLESIWIWTDVAVMALPQHSFIHMYILAYTEEAHIFNW